MTELKCPFCQKKLRQDQDGYYTCYTDNCGCMAFGGNGASGSESLWLALIDIKKKLDILQRFTNLSKNIKSAIRNNNDN